MNQHSNKGLRLTQRGLVLGTLFALLSAAFYGGLMPWTQLASNVGINSPDLAFYRIAVVGALLIPLALILRIPLKVPRPFHGTMLFYGACIWLVGLTYMGSVAFIPVGLAATIFFTFPILTVLLDHMLGTARITPQSAALVALAFTGLAIAIGPSINSLDPRGLLLASLAAIAATAMFFFASKLAVRFQVLTLAFWVHLVMFLPALVLVLLLGGPSQAVLEPTGYGPVLFVALGYGMAFLFQVKACALAPPSHVTQFYFLEPIAAAAAAAVVLGETLTWNQYFGGGLVLVALAILFRQARKLDRNEEPISDPKRLYGS